jgi:hypothetical protein
VEKLELPFDMRTYLYIIISEFVYVCVCIYIYIYIVTLWCPVFSTCVDQCKFFVTTFLNNIGLYWTGILIYSKCGSRHLTVTSWYGNLNCENPFAFWLFTAQYWFCKDKLLRFIYYGSHSKWSDLWNDSFPHTCSIKYTDSIRNRQNLVLWTYLNLGLHKVICMSEFPPCV